MPDFRATDPLLHFCRENSFNFTFSTLQRFPKNFSLDYYDLRPEEFSNIFDVVTHLFRKQIGILLKHKQQKISYEIGAKRTHEESFSKFLVEPIYPEDELPPLLELLNRSDFPKHDKLRFKLLKWTIDEEKLKKVDLSAIPKKYFQDVITLTWLTFNGLINTIEADLILLSIKHVELDLVPENIQLPQIVHHRAFRIAFMFTKFHNALSRSFQASGLKSMTVSVKLCICS